MKIRYLSHDSVDACKLSHALYCSYTEYIYLHMNRENTLGVLFDVLLLMFYISNSSEVVRSNWASDTYRDMEPIILF